MTCPSSRSVTTRPNGSTSRKPSPGHRAWVATSHHCRERAQRANKCDRAWPTERAKRGSVVSERSERTIVIELDRTSEARLGRERAQRANKCDRGLAGVPSAARDAVTARILDGRATLAGIKIE